MRAEDLQIGDWVRNDLGEIQQVVELREEGAMLSYNDIYQYDDIHPIPLTPEILEKNGLTLSLYGEHFPEDKRYDLEISVIEGDIYWTIECGYYGILRLRFVHELQHCLKLVGIKKDIVL